ncbi:MAG: hypothetical protein M3P12_09550 [Gemmatimonadota bacterium]|nr:hypothetical protein [Gemmatimonadota bacterium]
MRVRFAAQRVIIFDRGTLQDTVANVQELRGRVVALHRDTLVLRVAGGPLGSGREARALERQTTVVLDPSTVVSRTQMDSWKFAYGLLAGSVLIFAVLVMSGS